MGLFVKGEVVVLPFPFSDLSEAKRAPEGSPALVLAPLPGVDVILCMITSQTTKDDSAVAITSNDFVRGELAKLSYARPNRLFTADERLILRSAGLLAAEKTQEVVDAVVAILTRKPENINDKMTR
jgi:mRNA interferase MazF